MADIKKLNSSQSEFEKKLKDNPPKNLVEALNMLIEQFDPKAKATRNLLPEQPLIPIEGLGEAVREERKKQKITREVLSKLSGVSTGTIIAIEQKKLTVTLETAQKVLRALGKKLWIK